MAWVPCSFAWRVADVMSRLLRILRGERLEAGGDQDIALIRTRGRLHQEISERVRLMVVQTLA